MTDQNYLQKVLHERELKQLNKDLLNENTSLGECAEIHVRMVEINYALKLLKTLKIKKRHGKKTN